MAFFKFDVELEISYEVLDEQQDFDADESELDEAQSLYRAMQEVDAKNTVLTRKIYNEDKTTGELFKGILKKINILARLTSLHEHQHLRQVVYLGGDGVTFKTKAKLENDEQLKLRMVFLSSFEQVFLTARVTQCKKLSDEQFETEVEFENLSQEEEDIIVHHTLEAERNYIKNKATLASKEEQ